MILDFASMTANTVPGFKGGEGEAIVRKFDDPRMGAVVRITLPQGASIGLHTHSGNCEIVYVLSGSGAHNAQHQIQYRTGVVTAPPDKIAQQQHDSGQKQGGGLAAQNVSQRGVHHIQDSFLFIK